MVAPALLLLLLVLCYRFTSACKKKDSSVRQGGGDEWGGNGEVIWREKEKKNKTKQFVDQICFHPTTSSIISPARCLHCFSDTKQRPSWRESKE